MKRINLTMTRSDAATLFVALGEFLDVGTGEEPDESLLADEYMKTLATLQSRLWSLLKRPNNAVHLTAAADALSATDDTEPQAQVAADR